MMRVHCGISISMLVYWRVDCWCLHDLRMNYFVPAWARWAVHLGTPVGTAQK